MIHLDTHVLVWVAAGALERLPARLVDRLPQLPVRVSPMAVLELEFLHEAGRLGAPAPSVMDRLHRRLDLRVADESFGRAAARARDLTFTRDPFDRLIAGHALAEDLPLLTADRTLREHCAVARWEDWS